MTQQALAVTSVQELPHPMGEEGVITSLRRVVDKIRKARNNPIVISWVGEVLHKAGDPKGHVARAKAIYEAMQQQNLWMPDPRNVERMAGAHLTLGDGKNPPLFRAGDCDDLTIACLGACECAGIPTAVVGASYAQDKIISHVLGMISDGKGTWYYVDPSSKYPFGTAKEPTREYVIDIQTEKVICDDRMCSVTMRGTKPPEETRAGYYLSLDGIGDSDVYPVQTKSSEPYGLNDSEKQYLGSVIERIDTAWADFMRTYSAAQTALSSLGLPVLGDATNKMFGPAEMQRAVDLQEMVRLAKQGLFDVLEGRRKIWLEDGMFGADLAIEQLPADPLRVGLDLKSNLPYLYSNESNQVVHPSGQLNGWPLIAAGAAIVTIVVALSVAANAKYEAEKARAAADVEMLRKETELIKQGKTDELVKVYQARAQVHQASKPPTVGQSFQQAGEGILAGAKGVAVGAGAAALLYLLWKWK